MYGGYFRSLVESIRKRVVELRLIVIAKHNGIAFVLNKLNYLDGLSAVID